MKKLFIYFSLTGNGDFVAAKMEEKGYEVRKVKEKKKASKIFFFRVFWGGFRAGLGLKGKLIDYDNNVEGYDEIVIGSPVWNGKFPPAINSVLKQTDLSNAKLIFLFYSGSGDEPKVSKKIYKLFPKAKIIVMKEPHKHEAQLEKIKDM